MAGMPIWTARCLRSVLTASSMTTRSRSLSWAMPPLIWLMRCRMRVISSSGGAAAARAHSSTPAMAASPFAGAEQVIKVGSQVRQVGHVGAEVITAGAAEPDRAGFAAGCDVGRLGAGAVGDSDRADGVPGMLGVEQGAGLTPDRVAVPVEAHRGDLVDGGAAAVLPDPVIAAGLVQVLVVHQLGEHVDRDAGVSVPLSVGVPVGVGHDPGGVERRSVTGRQRTETAGPLAVPVLEPADTGRPVPGGVTQRGRQQCQSARRGIGKPGSDPRLLSDDNHRGVLTDRQPAAVPVRLAVVVDQHGLAVAVTGQAVQREGHDLLRTPPGIDGDLDRGPELSPLHALQRGAQHLHDLRRQVTSWLTGLSPGGDVRDGDDDIAGQPGRWLAGTVQAQHTDAVEESTGTTAQSGAMVTADRSR